MEKDLSKIKQIIYLCNGTSCTNNGAENNITTLRDSLTLNHLNQEVHTIRTKCSGFCKKGPIVSIQPENTWYQKVTPTVAQDIVNTHLLQNTLLPDYLLFSSATTKKKSFFKKLLDFWLLVLFFSFLSANGQQIKGIVEDVNTHLPIPNTTVTIKETGAKTTTDTNGYFEFTTPNTNFYTLFATCFGYESYAHRYNYKNQENNKITLSLSLNSLNLSEIVISATSNKTIENKIDRLNMQLQPIKSAQDLLRAIPGLFIAQHAGGGKAEQILVRGTDNDHGTDFNIQIDGIPVNLPSHAHGQGYADMHFIIPETIGTASFYKGPYEAKLGDFSVAGAALFGTKHRIEKNIVKLETGYFNTRRAYTQIKLLDQKHLVTKWHDNAYIASEYNYTNGYFDAPQNFKRFNIFGKYNAHIDQHLITLSGSYLNSSWNASGQIPLRAVQNNSMPLYGSIDDSEGGNTSRLNVNLQIESDLGNNQILSNQLYYTKNLFNLFSNFTFFMNNPITGDGIKQYENRDLFGIKSSYKRQDFLKNTQLDTEIGYTTRNDVLTLGRDLVKRRIFLENPNLDAINIANYSLYFQEAITFSPQWNIQLGIRTEWFDFNLKDKINTQNSGSRQVSLLNPKAIINYNITPQLSLFTKWGTGFHSNYAHTVIAQNTNFTDALPQSMGSDLGFKVKIKKQSLFTLTGWWTDNGSEYKFISDDASFENIGRVRKYGFDSFGTIQFTNYLWVDSAINYAYSVLRDAPTNENLVPFCPRWSATGGITLKLNNGLNSSLRYRFLGQRPALEDGSIYTKAYTIADFVIRYTKNSYEFALATENIANTKWNEAQFYDQSQLSNETQPVKDFHVTPGTPFFIKASISYLF